MVGGFTDGELIELVEFGLEDFFVREEGYIVGDEGRGEGAAKCIFDDFLILGGTE